MDDGPEDSRKPWHPDFIPATTDASIWAREFCKRFPSMDEGTMLGWFANAIMAGFDEGQRRAEARHASA